MIILVRTLQPAEFSIVEGMDLNSFVLAGREHEP